MGRATQEASRERLELIEKHREWAVKQEPMLHALYKFSEGCFVYAPAATVRRENDFDHAWTINSVVLVPERHCEEAVTIPADHVRLGAMNDHGVLVMIGPDTLAADERRQRFVSIDADFKVSLPGGTFAKLKKANDRDEYVIEEEKVDG